MAFNPGDVVQLESGGPVMTVEKIGKDQRAQEDAVFCTWFEKVGNRQELHREAFSPAVLNTYSPTFWVRSVRVERG